MPDFEPDKWNTPESQPFGNCYDYAVDHRTEWKPPAAKPKAGSVPGRTKDVTCSRAVLVVTPDGKLQGVVYDVTCQGVKTGAILDGLKEVPAEGKCEADCWKIAYFVRARTSNPPVTGDFHFARQDSDGGWSHKRGAGPVHRLPLPAAPDITPPPEVPDAVPGYQFCGYLCCCPNTQVAEGPPQEDEAMGESAMVSVFRDHSGQPTRLADASGAFAEAAEAGLGAPDADWRDGIGPGTVLYALDGGPGATWDSLLIADASVTEFAGGKARHLPDADGRLAARFARLVALAGLARARLPILAEITIGGAPLLPPGLVYRDQPDATVAAKGTLADACTWSLEIKVSTATLPVPDRPNCLFHVYKIDAKLTRTCTEETKVSSDTRITRTGPHCGDPAATPPVPAPQPKTESTFQGSKAPKDGPEEVTIALPDGTEVTITSPAGGTPTVTLGYPGGTPTTLAIP